MIAEMRSLGLATVHKVDFSSVRSVSRGDGVLRCVVVDGMAFLPNTITYAISAVDVVDKTSVSVLSITLVMNDRQRGRAESAEATHRFGDESKQLVGRIQEVAGMKGLSANLVCSRLYSSATKKAKGRMFWALFLLIPKSTGCDGDAPTCSERGRRSCESCLSTCFNPSTSYLGNAEI